MKRFPIRKYANITAKSNFQFIQLEVSPVTSGSSTRLKFAPQDPLFISWLQASCCLLSITSTPLTKSSDILPGPSLTQYIANYWGLWRQHPSRSLDTKLADYWRLWGYQQDEGTRKIDNLRTMISSNIQSFNKINTFFMHFMIVWGVSLLFFRW